MMNDLDERRLRIIEERVAALEQKTNTMSAPILDAIEAFRRDTLSLFEGFAARLEKKMTESELRTAERLERLEARTAKRFEESEARSDKRFEELLFEIRKGR